MVYSALAWHRELSLGRDLSSLPRHVGVTQAAKLEKRWRPLDKLRVTRCLAVYLRRAADSRQAVRLFRSSPSQRRHLTSRKDSILR